MFWFYVWFDLQVVIAFLVGVTDLLLDRGVFGFLYLFCCFVVCRLVFGVVACGWLWALESGGGVLCMFWGGWAGFV